MGDEVNMSSTLREMGSLILLMQDLYIPITYPVTLIGTLDAENHLQL